MRVLEANIIVSNCAEACNFYIDIFGAKIRYLSDTEQGYNEARIEIEDVHIHMFESNEKIRILPPDGQCRRYMWWQFICDDVDALYFRAMEQGCEAVEELRDLARFGVRQGTIIDPYGYCWILTQNMRALSPLDPPPLLAEKEAPPSLPLQPKREILNAPFPEEEE